MGTPFLSEIRIFAFNFAPKGWALCNGQLMAINQNQALFSLLGTTYGGNGVNNFQLPDMQGRVPMHMGQGWGSNFAIGQRGGEENHTLSPSEIPQHNHSLMASSAAASTNDPANTMLATTDASNRSYGASADTFLAVPSVGYAGSNQAHSNLQPLTVLNFCIALQGIFPSRN